MALKITRKAKRQRTASINDVPVVRNRRVKRRVKNTTYSPLSEDDFKMPEKIVDAKDIMEYKAPPASQEIPMNRRTRFLKVYDLEFAQKAYELTLAGFPLEATARVLGTTLVTLNSWRKLHPEFNKAIKRALSEATGKVVADGLMKLALGFEYEEEVVTYDRAAKLWVRTTVKKYQKPDYRAIVFFLKNKHPAMWNKEKMSVQDIPLTEVITNDPETGEKKKVTLDFTEYTDEELNDLRKALMVPDDADIEDGEVEYDSEEEEEQGS